MPTFDTPQPIAVTLSLVYGDVRFSASDRADTIVEVRPANSTGKSTKMAEQTQVEYADGRLLVKTPKHLTSMFGTPGSISVDIQLPAGSSLDGSTQMGDLSVDGRLGECQYRTGFGRIRLGQTGPLRLNTGAGDATVDRAEGDTEITTGTGGLRVGHIGGTAVIKNSNGSSWIGEVTGVARVNAANGSITVDRALGGVIAKTAHGSVEIGEAVRGSYELETGAGQVEVGIPVGTAAWLDVNTTAGGVRNFLDSAGGPESTDEQVQIRARTYFGDIVIRRS